MISIEAYRAAIGSYYNRAKSLSCRLYKPCPCINYEDIIFKHDGFRNLDFCIAIIELIYDVSFTKLLQLIKDGDVEINPGPSNMSTPKGRKSKKTTFNFTPKKLDMDSMNNNPNTENNRFQQDINYSI